MTMAVRTSDPPGRLARTRTLLVACTLLIGGVGCSTTHDETEKSNAQKLVKATRSAGVAPDLTVSAAEALYGTSAPQICDVLEGGIGSAESLVLKGNPAGRREKLITNDAVTYERLVVKTYCPDEIDSFNDLVDGIDTSD